MFYFCGESKYNIAMRARQALLPLLFLFFILSSVFGHEVTSNGAWCWFADPRALHYENKEGTINKTYIGYIDTKGNIKAMQYDFQKKRQDEVLVRSYFQPDDHNNPTFLVLPDERIMIFYSRHTDEACFYYRISRTPGDITTLGDEKQIKTKDNTTYPSSFILSGDPEHIYLCWRGIDWHPTIAKLSLPDENDDVSIVWGPYQMVKSTGARPYAKYFSNGKDKIYFTYTTGHPDNENPNFIYFNSIDIRSLELKDLKGKTLSTISEGPFHVDKTDKYAIQYPSTLVDKSAARDWVWQVTADEKGLPIIAMVQISADKTSHDYYYAKWNGYEWRKTFLANAGGYFHQTPHLEECYSSGMAIDPEKTNDVYCSLPVEGKYGRVYEIFRFTLDETGKVVSKIAVTQDSPLNNVRPYVISASINTPLRLTWMYGNYYDWIVSSQNPQGYSTGISCDFKGFPKIKQTHQSELDRNFAFNLDKPFTLEKIINLDSDHYQGILLQLGDLTYYLNGQTMKPEVRYKGRVYPSANILATSDNWKNAPRSTGGKWYLPQKFSCIKLRFDYKDGILCTYVNGLIDQNINLLAHNNVFTVLQPNFEKSPYTGMTRKHWIMAAEYLLKGAFSYIHTLDDQMYFPKQLTKTYPNDAGQIPVAKLEGLARTLFVAAPLLRNNPDLIMNGINVADYYRHQLVSISNPKSNSFIPHRKGGASQTLLELGSLAISMKAAQAVLWDPLTKAQKDSLAATMLSYGEGPTIGSNWMFFNVFILSFLKDQGYVINDDYLEMNLKKLLARYRGEGWYNDAPAYDYYSAWAYQTYGPIWAEMFGKRQYPELAQQFLANQHDMIKNYPYMFSRDGKMNMWGRSICYRFAATAPLSLFEYDKSGDVNYGWIRKIASSTLLQFLESPQFLEDGVPTMGFYGPFAPAVQIYSCRGSVYWCGKAFLSLLLPEEASYWSAIENNGPWNTELKKGEVYNKFQSGTNLLITNYPNSGGSEVRSWCHEPVSKDWQKFRSTENYNKLAYNTEFPWMADGDNGEISMNYGTKNTSGKWEVLRLYTFKSFKDGVYQRDAVLETDSTVKYQLSDIPLPNGILRVDKISVSQPTEICLGHYSLPQLNGVIKETYQRFGKQKIPVLNNGEYELVMLPLSGWDHVYTLYPTGLHPVSDECGLIMVSDKLSGSKIYATLQLWKKTSGTTGFEKSELNQVKSLEISKDQRKVTIQLHTGEIKTILFK